MKLFKNYSIKIKIRIIAISAITIISSMLISLLLFSSYFEKKELQLQNNQKMSDNISEKFKYKLLTNGSVALSKEEINHYFDNLKKYSNESIRVEEHKTIHYLYNTFIPLLAFLLLIFMFFGYFLNSTINHSLASLKSGMTKFFDYIIKNNQKIEEVDILYKDEVGDILHFINKNLSEVKRILENERNFHTQLEKNVNSQTELVKEKSNYLEQYKYMIDQTEAVIQFDMFGNIIDTNEQYCELSKYSKEELIGKPIVNFLNTKNQDNEFYKEITNVIIEGSVYKGINSDVAKDGEIFTTKTVILPIVTKDGIIEYFFCVRTDITQITALTDDIIATQKDVISTMGEIGESRSKETGLHVKRVAEYSKLLAVKSGLDKEQCDLIYNASPMHDIGKVAIPDSILKKPEKLTKEEYKIMQTHAQLGYDMLKNSKRDILSAAAIIAHEHHEKYDGSGYPHNKKGNNIHIFGRITAIADIFDALGSDRCYKKAWDLDKIIELLVNEKGKHFDPILVDLFIENIEEFLAIRDRLKDDIKFVE